MKNMHLRLLNILLLVLWFAVSPTALAQKIQVNSTNPASAVQGTFNLDVEIAGGGFDDTIDVVEFLLPCDVEPCTDTGGITVKQNSIRVHSRKKLTVNIDVPENAVVADFDIAVRSTFRGRGGKGTTLFSVQAKDSNDNSGDNEGWLGELGNGCVTFSNSSSGPGTIYEDDIGGPYCNGTAGQISVPSSLRLDTKKFNKPGREFLAQLDCGGIVIEPDACSGAEVEAILFQSMLEYVKVFEDVWIPYADLRQLNFPEMSENEVTRVSMYIKLGGKTGLLVFGEAPQVAFACDEVLDGEPIWVRCDHYNETIGIEICDRWTVSTNSLDDSGLPPANACLNSGSGKSTLVARDVIADFTIEVCVLGTVGCP